jgi:uncharacterized phage-associated protein
VDREALLRLGRPVTHDSYVSMPHGPVLSATLHRINEPAQSQGAYWHRYIAPKHNHEVRLVSPDAPNDQLSPAEEQLIDEVFHKFGRMSRWELRDFTHTLPEWRDPRGSSRPIDWADILRGEGYSNEDIDEIAADLEESAIADALF